RDFSGNGRMLVEGEPQGHVPCALEFTRGRMRATRAENPGHQRGRVGKFPMVFISLGSPIEKVASFRNASCICKKLLCSNKTNVTHRHARSTDRKSTRLNSSHVAISYAVFCLKKKNQKPLNHRPSSKQL